MKIIVNKISMYQLYDEKIAAELKFEHEVEFFYEKECREYLLQPAWDYEQKLLLSNEDDSWEYGVYGLGISIQFKFKSILALFGIDKLVNIDAEIGLALQWTSKQSSQRGNIPFASIKQNTPENTIFSVKHYFSKDLLFEEVVVAIIFYLKKPSRSPQNGQAQLVGTILGELVAWEIILDGLGSTFPIVVVNEPDKPLWYVDFNYSNPFIEPFDKEYIAIYLNRAHAAYSAVQNPQTIVEQTLYVSFLAGALHLILQDLMKCDEWEDIQEGKNCEEGSIGQVMYYFRKTFNWNFDTPEKLAMSLHKDLETRLKAGGI